MSKRILDKLDQIDQRLSDIDKTLVKNTENLAEHMRRTSLIENDLRPVKKHVVMVEGAFKFLGVVSLIVGIAAAVVKIAQAF